MPATSCPFFARQTIRPAETEKTIRAADHGHVQGLVAVGTALSATGMEPTVIYNGACPICRREIDLYRRYCAAEDVPLHFADLNTTDLAPHGITSEDARRRLHIVHEGRVVSGLPAFLILWRKMPRFRWLARLLGLPVIRPLAGWVYDRVLAPVLHALDRRRRRIAREHAAR